MALAEAQFGERLARRRSPLADGHSARVQTLLVEPLKHHQVCLLDGPAQHAVVVLAHQRRLPLDLVLRDEVRPQDMGEQADGRLQFFGHHHVRPRLRERLHVRDEAGPGEDLERRVEVPRHRHDAPRRVPVVDRDHQQLGARGAEAQQDRLARGVAVDRFRAVGIGRAQTVRVEVADGVWDAALAQHARQPPPRRPVADHDRVVLQVHPVAVAAGRLGVVFDLPAQGRDARRERDQARRRQHQHDRHRDEPLAAHLTQPRRREPRLGPRDGQHERELPDLPQRQARRQRDAQRVAQHPRAERRQPALQHQHAHRRRRHPADVREQENRIEQHPDRQEERGREQGLQRQDLAQRVLGVVALGHEQACQERP